jgi:hypothetical protein
MRRRKQVFIAFKMMQIPVNVVYHMIAMHHPFIPA